MRVEAPLTMDPPRVETASRSISHSTIVFSALRTSPGALMETSKETLRTDSVSELDRSRVGLFQFFDGPNDKKNQAEPIKSSTETDIRGIRREDIELVSGLSIAGISFKAR
ncbi:MAG: hypothetical protein DWI24_02200 [Planctomycetota bacterium]|nr:MAG: hypothetical protein DWI24_02200 [Planctomycetota bacterium]